MTRDQLKSQVLNRLRLTLKPNARRVAQELIDEILSPYAERDRTIDPGKVNQERWSPELRQMVVEEKQIHSPRPAVPYNFGAESVLWLEREVRRRMAL